MKMLKILNWDDWAKKRSPGMNSPLNVPQWSWGLGEDGLLYGKGSITGYSYNWMQSHQLSFSLSLKEMMMIVAEFKDLLVFL